MKCPHCGGEVGLEEKFCPWCGKPNEQSVQHREDMARFQAAYSATEQSVEKKTKHVVRLMPRLIVLLVLLVITVVASLIGSQAWEMSEHAKRSSAERNVTEVRAMLDGYLEQRDYVSFANYMEYHDISYYRGPFADYDNIYYCAMRYADIVQRLEHIYLRRDRASREKSNASSDARYLSGDIADFFSELKSMANRDLTKKDERCLDDLRLLTEEMLRAFLGLDQKALEDFLTQSENKQAVIIEEVILGA